MMKDALAARMRTNSMGVATSVNKVSRALEADLLTDDHLQQLKSRVSSLQRDINLATRMMRKAAAAKLQAK